MLKNILLIFVLFLCLLAATGSIFLMPATQKLTVEDEGTTVYLKTGDELLVTLEGNPSTGYTWILAPAESTLLEQVGETEFKPEIDLTGAPGEITLRLKAVATGEQTIRLIYIRPWETGAEPLDTFEFTVIVE